MMSTIWKCAAVSAALLTLTLGLGPSQIAAPAEAKGTKDAGYGACFNWCAANRSGIEKTKCECGCNIYYHGRKMAQNMLSCVSIRSKA